MATKAVCVLKSDKVNGVVHFNQEVISELFYVLHVISYLCSWKQKSLFKQEITI